MSWLNQTEAQVAAAWPAPSLTQQPPPMDCLPWLDSQNVGQTPDLRLDPHQGRVTPHHSSCLPQITHQGVSTPHRPIPLSKSGAGKYPWNARILRSHMWYRLLMIVKFTFTTLLSPRVGRNCSFLKVWWDMLHILATITAGLMQLRRFPAGPHKSLLQHPFLWYRGEVQVPFTLVGEYFRGPSTLVHGSVTGTLACIMVHVTITGTLYYLLSLYIPPCIPPSNPLLWTNYASKPDILSQDSTRHTQSEYIHWTSFMRRRKSIARVREGKSNIWSWGIVSNWFPICRIDYIYGIGRHQDKDYLRQPMMQ